MKNPLTLYQVIDGFMLSLNARRLSENTIRDYRTTINYLCEFIQSNPPFEDLTKTQIQNFLASRSVSNKTIFNYHIGLSALWTWAVNEEIVDTHIIRQIPRPKPEKSEIVPYSKDDIKRMLSNLDRSRTYMRRGKRIRGRVLNHINRHRAIILLLVDTGIRADELYNLMIHQTDFKNLQIKVWGKGSKQRSIPISPHTSQSIWRYINTRDDDHMGAYTFTTKFNRRFTTDRLRRIIQNIGARSGVSDVTVHRFRHTFAINYLRNGGDIYTLQRILGHSTMLMVQRYLAIAEADITAAHRKASPVANWGL